MMGGCRWLQVLHRVSWGEEPVYFEEHDPIRFGGGNQRMMARLRHFVATAACLLAGLVSTAGVSAQTVVLQVSSSVVHRVLIRDMPTSLLSDSVEMNAWISILVSV